MFLLLLAVGEIQLNSAPLTNEPANLILVRRPEEISLPPKYTGQTIDLGKLVEKARKANYSEKRVGDSLYLLSSGILPIALWQEEDRARRNIMAKIALDGTLNVRADSDEGRFLLGSMGITEDYGDELQMRVSSHVRLTLQSGGRSINLNLNPPIKPRKTIPEAVPRERSTSKSPSQSALTSASAQAIRGEYVFETIGRIMFFAPDTLLSRKAALEVTETMAKPYMDAEILSRQQMYTTLAPLSVDERQIPTRGTSYNTLSAAVRDDIEYAIRNNPAQYGFSDEQEAAKWLAGASVSGSQVSAGVELNTPSVVYSVELARRRY